MYINEIRLNNLNINKTS